MTASSTILERVLAAREAGHVRRCHGTPHLGEYTVGKHSFDALSLLLILHPGPSRELMQAVLWHDSAERWVGDLPAPVLAMFPELKSHYETAEEHVRRQRGLPLPELEPDDQAWLRAVDRIELWLWCREQLHLGNRHVENMERAIRASFGSWSGMPRECLKLIALIVSKDTNTALWWGRTEELK